MGGCRRQFSSCFDDTADLESFPNGGLKVTETQRFCFLLDFQNFLREEKVGSRQGGREKLGEPQGTWKGIKNLKVAPLVSIKGSVDEETKICS